jgi:hypothetical protein
MILSRGSGQRATSSIAATPAAEPSVASRTFSGCRTYAPPASSSAENDSFGISVFVTPRIVTYTNTAHKAITSAPIAKTTVSDATAVTAFLMTPA